MSDFIRQIVERDLAAGKHPGGIVTRFPPEPNGFLHIGHAKSIVLNFGIARDYPPARCHLRFDDTNPITENVAYVRAIQEDVRWLGFDWGEHLYYASDYFEAMYGFAEHLIERGLAYVDSSSEEEIRAGRGTVKEPGTASKDRDRPIEENLDLFRRMRAGEFPDGSLVLRARINMASPNMLMRDPVLYRIRHAHHYRTGDDWCIYPLYDYAHALEDALEGITHSICTLEFENNRELYDWVVENCPVPSRPHQYEFARLNLDYTVMSKRKLLRLVDEGDVTGWDDPRMPTVAGMRRRGVTPEAIRSFCELIGVAKADSRVDMGKLEYAIRDDLNHRAPRVLAVLDPLPVRITNWPEGEVETLEASYWPHDVPNEGTRSLTFSGRLFLDREDFAEVPPPGFRRLIPGEAVRLRHGYVIHCDEVVKDASGKVVELLCRYDPTTRSGASDAESTFGWKPRGTLQWVSEAGSVPCEVRLYDRLFVEADPDAAAAAGEVDFRTFLNPDSLRVASSARIEASVLSDDPATRYQFERLGYFWRDPEEGQGERLVFNRIVTLRDAWARAQAGDTAPKGGQEKGSREARAGAAAGAGAQPGASPKAPELPPEVQARAHDLEREFGLGTVEAAILARDPEDEHFFRQAVAAWSGPMGGDGGAQALANWFIHNLPPLREGRALGTLALTPVAFAGVVKLVEGGTLSSRGGTTVLEVLVARGGDPEALTRELDLAQVSDDEALRPVVQAVVAENADKAEAYRGGKIGLLGFFMGEIMRRSGGKADPERAKSLLVEALAGPADAPAGG
jgi:glutaminyl-tRNA synthetase